MRKFTRRDFLGGTVGAAALFAGCSESSSTSTSGFTETRVEDQQLVVEFEESVEAETISVIDPAGEAFAETSVATGASRVTFDIPMPYTPGEYRLVAAADDETLTETTQTLQPELDIIDVGIGANRLDEMPKERGGGRDAEGLVVIENTGTGPELISKLTFLGDIPNPNNPEEVRIGVYNPEIPGERHNPVQLNSGRKKTIYSSTLPFLFEGDGVDCSSESQTGEMELKIEGEVKSEYSTVYRIEYTASESYNSCQISLSEAE